LAEGQEAVVRTHEELFGFLRSKLEQGTWFGIHEAIIGLSNNTGRKKIIDPFENPDSDLWSCVWNFLYFQTKLYSEALTVSQTFLDLYYALQEEEKKRIHKGTPLQYLGLSYFSLNNIEQSRKFHILAFIEDVIRHFESQKPKSKTPPLAMVSTPATITLRTRFRMTDLDLKGLQDFVWKTAYNSVPFYPEQVFVDWIRNNEKSAKIIARSEEERLYHVNLQYLRQLETIAFKDKTGVGLERLAFYLFSCVDGFEPIYRKTTKSFHFDVLVRNLINDHVLLETLGEYIGVECKKIGETVTAEDLDHFIHKLRLHNMRSGVIFTTEGISGAKYKRTVYGESIIEKTFQRDGVVIFDITKADVESLSQGCNLLALLLRKYENTRFK
jgi:hypothetical protein